jgi:hypothetical protein
VVARSDDPANWRWEIHRHSRPLGIRLYRTRTGVGKSIAIRGHLAFGFMARALFPRRALV